MDALSLFVGSLLPTNLIDWWSGFGYGFSGLLLMFALGYRRGRIGVR